MAIDRKGAAAFGHVRELPFSDTFVSVGGCGDVFDGDVDVGELGAGQGGDVAVDDRAYSLDERFDRWSVGDDEADCDAEAPGVGGLVGNGAGGGEDDTGDCESDALDHAAHEGVADAGFSAGVAEEDGVGGVAGEDADARHDLCGQGWRDGHGLGSERVDVFPGVAQAAQRRLAVGTVGLVGGVGGGFVVGDLGNQLLEVSAAWQSPGVLRSSPSCGVLDYGEPRAVDAAFDGGHAGVERVGHLVVGEAFELSQYQGRALVAG